MKSIVFIKKRFSIYGGGENYLNTLLHRLKNNYEITILSSDWTPSEGVAFRKIASSGAGSFLSNTSFNRNACRLLTGMRPDCVISFERTTSQDIYRAGEGCHAEWLEIRSGTEPLYKRLSFRINPLHTSLLGLEKRLFSDTGLIIANSEMVKRNIMKHYAVPEQRIAVIYNGVDLARFSPENKSRWRDGVREGLSAPQDAKLLLFVGSGFKRKGLKAIMDAVSLIKDHHVKLLVIGKGEAGRYRAYAGRLGVADRIIFLGPQREIERFYAAADLFVLPTLYDPFSNATLEAMAAGLPAITTKFNGAAELIGNGREGFVINDPADTRGLAEAIAASLEDAADIGARARERAEKFPIEAAADGFVEVIDRTIRDRRATGADRQAAS